MGVATISIEDQLFCDYRDNGNKNSFEELFIIVKPWLLKMLCNIVADRDVAEDLQQETWIKVLRKKDSFDPKKGKISNLIFTIAKNEALKWIRDNKKFYRSSTMENTDGGSPVFGVEERNPEINFQEVERTNAISKAIKRLPQDYQDVILLYYFGELSIKYIAITLDKPEGTVKTWLDRGRKKLKKTLPKYLS